MALLILFGCSGDLVGEGLRARPSSPCRYLKRYKELVHSIAIFHLPFAENLVSPLNVGLAVLLVHPDPIEAKRADTEIRPYEIA